MTTEPPVGIHDLTFSTTTLVLTHDELARHTGANPAKYRHGIGQTSISIPTPDEDIVTMAAGAGAPIIERHGKDRIRTLLFATETGIDQSKAAGIYVHQLLGLNRNVRVVELKQACYGATAALQLACALVRTDPTQQVLVLAGDIARYDLDSPGEATQGAAAAAILIAAHPNIAVINAPSGLYTRDVMDFWRPNYRTTPSSTERSPSTPTSKPSPPPGTTTRPAAASPSKSSGPSATTSPSPAWRTKPTTTCSRPPAQHPPSMPSKVQSRPPPPTTRPSATATPPPST